MTECGKPGPVFDSSSQRVAHSYRISLANWLLQAPDDSDGSAEQVRTSQRALQQFYGAWYESMFDHPEWYGLPQTTDAYLEDGDNTRKKQDINRMLRKPRDLVNNGVELLYAVAQQARLDERGFSMPREEYAALLPKNAKGLRAFISGLGNVGLLVEEGDGEVLFRSALYPAMMPAWKALASRCAQNSTPEIGSFCFARCDFKADGVRYQPEPEDLINILARAGYPQAARLHEMLIGTGYKPILKIYGVFGWELQYQGDRKSKGSPFFEIEYAERYRNQLQVQLKCASANRLVPLMPAQPDCVREDWSKRVYRCRGDACGWCKNRKSLGPSVFEYMGEREKKTICWYTNPDVRELNDAMLTTIGHYAVLHQNLA